jgi:subtilase family serine protease
MALGPAQLRNAYFPGEEPKAPASQPQTIALVDSYNDLGAEADLKVYDEEFGLPACTAADGCFEEVNQSGERAKPPFPSSVGERHEFEVLCEDATAPVSESEAACEAVEEADGWSLEMSLDIEIAHAICQNCHIVLVEADSSELASLEAAV